MSAIALQALAEETGGQLVGESVALHNLAIDSRDVKAGDLFAALSGQRVDGHDFAPQALAAGASALLTERKLEGLSPQLVVADVLQASGRFGCLKRQAFDGDVIAITGSAGKTTTKNLVAAALATAGQVHATVGNQNNELGVPITLSGLTSNHRFGVIEMGAGQPGDIAYLCQLARPNVAVCLNASAAHLAHYDSVDAIAATKGEIFAGLAGKGLAVINADQKWLPQWREQAGTSRQVTFGLAEDADYRATDIEHRGMEGSHFQLLTPAGSQPVSLQLAGAQHVKNALAALAIAIEIGVTPSDAARALQAVGAGAGRGAVTHLPGGGTVVDDSYNANPAAVNAALQVLSRQPGYRVLVLGPMLELGEDSQSLHREVGRYAKQLGIDQLITVGGEATPAAEAFGRDALCFADQATLQSGFPALPVEYTIWVKGSRGAGLEHTVAWLLNSGGAAAC
jgi:UDP-N-acetylmuramoyl-tripeptide--D-alanyl-D-alanine ligase